jgi:hypothetical protein
MMRLGSTLDMRNASILPRQSRIFHLVTVQRQGVGSTTDRRLGRISIASRLAVGGSRVVDERVARETLIS